MTRDRILFAVFGLILAVAVAAFVIPNCLESQRSATCHQVYFDLFTIRSAEEAYRLSPQGGGRYAGNLETLVRAEGLGEEHLSWLRRLADNKFRKEGFVFGCISVGTNGYVYHAVPEIYGETARDIWVINQDGIMYRKDCGNSIPPAEWPSDPIAAGWTRTE